VTRERAGGRWLATALAASAALLSGCTGTGSVDPGELPGVYRDEASGSEVVLASDGTFSATDVAGKAVGAGGADPVDFSGRWEFVDGGGSGGFVYLTVDAGELGRVGGMKLHPSGRAVEFHADPDGPPSSRLRLDLCGDGGVTRTCRPGRPARRCGGSEAPGSAGSIRCGCRTSLLYGKPKPPPG
jgi:hypothetical protein